MDALQIPRAAALAALATLVALVSLACVPSARAADTGANAELSYGIPRADIDREIRLLEGAHVSWVRMNVGWDGVEPTSRGRHDERLLGDFDHAVSRLHRVGIGVVMPVADGVPFWASGDPRKRTVHGAHRWNVHYRPRRFADYARFFSWVVRRYSHLGVHVYEVWNEPNIARFWPSGPDPGAYTAMLRAAYPAIKRADPASTVVLGGLSQNDHEFLRGIYAHGGGRSFDAVGDHVYPDGDPARCQDEASGARSRDSLCGVEDAPCDGGRRRRPEARMDHRVRVVDDHLGPRGERDAAGLLSEDGARPVRLLSVAQGGPRLPAAQRPLPARPPRGLGGQPWPRAHELLAQAGLRRLGRLRDDELAARRSWGTLGAALP